MHPEKREEWNFRKIENIKELEKHFSQRPKQNIFSKHIRGRGNDSVQEGQQLKYKLSKHTDTAEFHFVKRSEMGMHNGNLEPKDRRSS